MDICGKWAPCSDWKDRIQTRPHGLTTGNDWKSLQNQIAFCIEHYEFCLLLIRPKYYCFPYFCASLCLSFPHPPTDHNISNTRIIFGTMFDLAMSLNDYGLSWLGYVNFCNCRDILNLVPFSYHYYWDANVLGVTLFRVRNSNSVQLLTTGPFLQWLDYKNCTFCGTLRCVPYSDYWPDEGYPLRIFLW